MKSNVKILTHSVQEPINNIKVIIEATNGLSLNIVEDSNILDILFACNDAVFSHKKELKNNKWYEIIMELNSFLEEDNELFVSHFNLFYSYLNQSQKKDFIKNIFEFEEILEVDLLLMLINTIINNQNITINEYILEVFFKYIDKEDILVETPGILYKLNLNLDDEKIQKKIKHLKEITLHKSFEQTIIKNLEFYFPCT